MKVISALLLVVSLPAMAQPPQGLKLLPDNIQATRVKSATFLRLLPTTQKNERGEEEVASLSEDDGLTQGGKGWYFTDLGYERVLVRTAEIQVQLNNLKAQVASCEASPVLTLPSPQSGFSMQALLVTGLLGILVGGGVVLVLNHPSTTR